MRPTLDGGVGSSNILQSLLTGDRVFLPKYDTWLRRLGVLGPYRRGEIVVVREPENSPTAQFGNRRNFFIKRLIARGGDRLHIENGQVYVNGYPIDQSFITASGEIVPEPVNFPVVVVEGGEVVGFQGLVPGTRAGKSERLRACVRRQPAGSTLLRVHAGRARAHLPRRPRGCAFCPRPHRPGGYTTSSWATTAARAGARTRATSARCPRFL